MTRREPKSNAVAEPRAYRAPRPSPARVDPTDFANDRRPPIVFERDGQIRTTSREVAEQFGKQHRHVLESIDALIASEPFLSEGGMPIFRQTPYVEPTTGQTYRQYEMTRDGFAVLGMGFTGKRALRFKLDYIAAFNRMETMLKGQSLAGPESLAALVDRLVDQRLEADPRVAVLNYRLPITILQEAGVPPKGRRGFSNTIRGKLVRYCVDREIPMRRSPETDRQMFHVDAVNGWLKLEGNRLIADRLDQIGRQGVLKLVGT